MKLILKQGWPALDFARLFADGDVVDAEEYIQAGTHEVERRDHPARPGVSIIVLKGTLIGATEGSWRLMSDPKHGELQVTIEE